MESGMTTHPRYRMRPLANKGFTLIEVILTAAVLSFGIVSIYEALFVSVDAYGYYTHYLNVQDWISDKLWEMQEELTQSGQLETEKTAGRFVRGHKTYDWSVVASLLDEEQGLYKVNVTLSWSEGDKKANITRETFLLPPGLRSYNEENSV